MVISSCISPQGRFVLWLKVYDTGIGISREFLPRIYDPGVVDQLEYVSQAEAEAMTRRLAREEGIFAGISSGGALAVALRLSQQLENAVIVSIICDRGDRYLSTGVFPA